VLLNFPLALVAIPIVLFLLPLLEGRWARVAAVVSIALAAVILRPGVVTESHLDARPVNAIPALGVLAAAVLTVVAARGRRFAWARRQRGDGLRVIVAAAALGFGVPWIAADVGISFGGVPVLGALYQTSEPHTQPDRVGIHPAVHLGHHHGMDGVLLVLCALLLSRLVSSAPGRIMRPTLGAYLAVMFCYVAGNLANDFWLEQVVKRGWTDWAIPDVTNPAVNIAWGLILLSAGVIWGSAVLLGRRPTTRSDTGYAIPGEAEA
jgi:hypothetical protein